MKGDDVETKKEITKKLLALVLVQGTDKLDFCVPLYNLSKDKEKELINRIHSQGKVFISGNLIIDFEPKRYDFIYIDIIEETRPF